MKSRTRTTAAGLVAACAAVASSSATSVAAPLSSSSAAGGAATPCGGHRGPLNRIPRGGHSPASAETAENASRAGEGEKRRKKKARSRRPKGASPSSPSQSHKSTRRRDDAESDAQSSSQNSTSEGNGSSPLPPAARSILSQNCYYDVLGVTSSASQSEIQKAYRRRCVLTHPDKTQGDRSAFDKVSEAYDVMSCERKRAVYDKFGKEGLEGGASADGARGGSFFGNEAFRDFFGADPRFARRNGQSGPFRRPPPAPRNRDLRYQLEVTLEELHAGATKRVAIQQPDPLRPHFPFRKEVEVRLGPGMRDGRSVRLAGAADGVPDAAPADVVFLIRERRHPVYTRRGSDLAMDVKISFAESVVGFRREVKRLDGRTVVIGSPFVERVVRTEEVVDVPAQPTEEEDDHVVVLGDLDNANSTNVTTNVTADEETTPALQTPKQITRTTTVTYKLPPSVIQTGDVHVLKGHGMPREGGHDGDEHGDLYVQYAVEAPGSSAGRRPDAKNLSPGERVELARLLSKLGGGDDPSEHAVRTTVDAGDDGSNGVSVEKADEGVAVERLSMASASDFGRDEHCHDGDDGDEEQQMPHDGFGSTADVGDFFQQAFGGRPRPAGGFGGPFGLGGGAGGGFRYFSSGGGQNHGGGGEEDHKVECNQM